MTPTKKTATSDVSYRFMLQESDISRTSVLGFGGACYEKLKGHIESRCPVKLKSKWNDKYETLILNENSGIERGKNVDSMK